MSTSRSSRTFCSCKIPTATIARTHVFARLVGFDTADSHHGIAAFEWGPGGNLYFNEGTFKFSQVESPYGLTRLHEAGIWRYDPRTEKLGVHVSFAFSNPWGHVFDRWGQDFIADASPGFSYWATPISGHIEYPLKHPGGSQHKRMAKETGGDPNFQFPTFYPKRTRPSAGCELVSSRHFPPEAQGNFLLTNCIGDRAVLNHKVREDGSGFKGEEVDTVGLVRDGNFRPVDIQFAPDGSLYIVDWHNALIGHLQHNLRDPNRDHQPRSHLASDLQGPTAGEASENRRRADSRAARTAEGARGSHSLRGRRELAERETDEVIAAVKAWVASCRGGTDYEHHLLEALWLRQTHNDVHRELLNRLLEPKTIATGRQRCACCPTGAIACRSRWPC